MSDTVTIASRFNGPADSGNGGYSCGLLAAFIEEGGDISEIRKIDQSKFNYLLNFDTLAGRNAQKVYTELEWE